MLRFILLCFCIVGLRAEFLGEVTLAKDEVKTLNVFVENTRKTLSFRWTLYKDKALIMHFKYDNIPHQFIVYKDGSNSIKINLSSINSFSNENPHIIFYFVDFNDDSKMAKFRYYLFRFNNNVEVM
ncbi:hypothetical protein [Helicobacter sp. 16-1353]|uniref:hypothetical protein n=1 Tax=Helicobacter sp. 16-1353 TaxID=2004996 RepID=UPI00215C89BB|nr:hypothetical protein [Helicobacter sp. 16-1353]